MDMMLFVLPTLGTFQEIVEIKLYLGGLCPLLQETRDVLCPPQRTEDDGSLASTLRIEAE